MRFFAKSRTLPGWLAVTVDPAGARAVHVKREPNARPAVELAAFFPAEPEREADALQRACKELHAASYRCTTLLNEGAYQIVSVEAPNVPPDELKVAIRWRVKDLLDFHIDDATIDVLAIPSERNASSRAKSMYVVAARNQIVQQRQALFEQARFPLSVIDIPELAQRNVASLAEPEGRGLAMISFAGAAGLLTVSFGGELCLSRRIDIGFEQLLHANEQERNGLLDRITLELQRSLDHVDRQFHFITLSKLLIAPLGESDAGLKDYLASNLHLPVEHFALDSVLNLERVPELLNPETQRLFLPAIGAALRHEEAVP